MCRKLSGFAPSDTDRQRRRRASVQTAFRRDDHSRPREALELVSPIGRHYERYAQGSHDLETSERTKGGQGASQSCQDGERHHQRSFRANQQMEANVQRHGKLESCEERMRASEDQALDQRAMRILAKHFANDKYEQAKDVLKDWQERERRLETEFRGDEERSRRTAGACRSGASAWSQRPRGVRQRVPIEGLEIDDRTSVKRRRMM